MEFKNDIIDFLYKLRHTKINTGHKVHTSIKIAILTWKVFWCYEYLDKYNGFPIVESTCSAINFAIRERQGQRDIKNRESVLNTY